MFFHVTPHMEILWTEIRLPWWPILRNTTDDPSVKELFTQILHDVRSETVGCSVAFVIVFAEGRFLRRGVVHFAKRKKKIQSKCRLSHVAGRRTVQWAGHQQYNTTRLQTNDVGNYSQMFRADCLQLINATFHTPISPKSWESDPCSYDISDCEWPQE
jgi:hypothetical protein